MVTRRGQTIERAVVDDELRHIGAEDIGHKGGIDQGRIRQGRLTAGRPRRQGPAKAQRIPIGITGAAAIELHGLPHCAPGADPAPHWPPGGRFSTVMVTVAGRLSSVPSLTMSCAT